MGARRMDGRLGCSTISFRALPLPDALARIAGLGFGEIDLGALPGTCDHVPTPLPAAQVDVIAGQVRDSGLAVRVINADVADMDDPDLDEPDLRRRLATLVELATAIGSPAIVLPSGRKGTTPRTELRRDVATVARTIATAAGIAGEAGLALLVEAPYSNRLCSTLDRAALLYDALDRLAGDAPVGAVLDVSHVVAVGEDPVDAVARLGDRIRHVHLRDATPGRINVSIGRGAVDFAAALGALTAAGYRGHFSLELETRDLDDADRPAETGRAGHYISSLLQNSEETPMSVSENPTSAKTALVTGAGSRRGIGRATAHTLAAAGWHIAVLDLDEAGAKDAATEIADQHGVQAVGVGCDITDAASVETALATVAAAVPPVGALVNNAGVTSPIPFLEVTAEEWERMFAVNVRGSYNVTRQLAPGMVERGFGRIVFLSSVSAERGGGVFGGVAYSAAKAGQLGFARALARELGPHGVTVNSVAPGLIDTDITAGKLVGEKEQQVLATVPVGRKGRAADVADLITYLCRPESGYITGATYDVNGGSHIH